MNYLLDNNVCMLIHFMRNKSYAHDVSFKADKNIPNALIFAN